MRKSRGQAWLLCAVVAASVWWAHAQEALTPAEFDTARSWLGFEVRTRFGQRMQGEFPRFEGLVEHLPDGRHRVRLRVATSAAVIPERPRYTGWMRGESFFDTARHPWMEFVSEPYPAALLRQGGPLKGELTLRGITRGQQLEIEPAACARPGLDCEIQVAGSIERGDYGMKDWQFALAERVRLMARLRLREAPR